MKPICTIIVAVLVGQPLIAAEFRLSPPLDCNLNETCFIQQFVDLDPTVGSQEFGCGSATYDGHKGTDFRVPTAADLNSDAAVLASADGVVVGQRDGMVDKRLQTEADAAAIAGRECGNGVVLDHGDGWQTQYCHMKQGSVTVAKGDRVTRGRVLGLIGLSGRTQFPHVHISVTRHGEVVDPFQYQRAEPACGFQADNSLWKEDFTNTFVYQPTQVVIAGVADSGVDYNAAMDGVYAGFTPRLRSHPLVAYGLVINVLAGDILHLELTGPQGVIVKNSRVPFTKSKADWLSFAGQKAPIGGWPQGKYRALVQILRNGQVIAEKNHSVLMR